jgi:RimJ/RimL family protein N-acetyltransferase
MLDAYRDTIDYEGETPAEAAAEVERYLAADSEHAPLLRQSVLLAAGNTLQCACLAKRWPLRRCPLIAYVVCRPGSQRGGLASFALARTLGLLQRAGDGEVRAIITEGNEPSERLFARAGFRKLVRA